MFGTLLLNIKFEFLRAITFSGINIRVVLIVIFSDFLTVFAPFLEQW